MSSSDPLTPEERAALVPLLTEERTLTEHGAEYLRPLADRGYVRLSPALCMGQRTGETMATLTEAGRFVLTTASPIPTPQEISARLERFDAQWGTASPTPTPTPKDVDLKLHAALSRPAASPTPAATEDSDAPAE